MPIRSPNPPQINQMECTQFTGESFEDEYRTFVTIEGKRIGKRSEITDITVKEGVVTIDEECFVDSINLRSVNVLSRTLKSIGRKAFFHNNSLVYIYNLPNSVTYCGDQCFSGW